MTKFYIQTIKDGIEYDIPNNVIETIRLTYDLDDTEIVFCSTIPEDDKIAAKEGRALQFEAVRDIAETACETELVSKAADPIVTNETPVETPEEEHENHKEENKMTKMTKTLSKLIADSVRPITSEYAPQLADLKNAYESARDTLKKIRNTEDETVKAAKETFDSTEKGTVARKVAGLDLKAARDHKKVAVGKAKLEYDTAKLTYDKLVAEMNVKVAEVTRGLINGYQPVVAVLDNEQVKKEEQTAEDKPVAEEAENTDSGTGTGTSVDDEPAADNTPVNDEPAAENTPVDEPATDAPAPLPVKTFAVLSFGNVGNKVEAFRTKILASTKYAWKEVQDWKQAELIRVYTQAGAKITSDESAELAAILQAEKAAPGRVHFDRVA